MQKADCSNSPDEKEVKPSSSPTSEREAAERWLRWSQCDLTAGLSDEVRIEEIEAFLNVLARNILSRT